MPDVVGNAPRGSRPVAVGCAFLQHGTAQQTQIDFGRSRPLGPGARSGRFSEPLHHMHHLDLLQHGHGLEVGVRETETS